MATVAVRILVPDGLTLGELMGHTEVLYNAARLFLQHPAAGGYPLDVVSADPGASLAKLVAAAWNTHPGRPPLSEGDVRRWFKQIESSYFSSADLQANAPGDPRWELLSRTHQDCQAILEIASCHSSN